MISDSKILWDSITQGRTDFVFEFVVENPSTTANNGVSLIQWCAYYGDVSAIKFLLSKGESIHSLGTNLDLNGAVFHGHLRLCEYLIEQGADVNYPLPDTGETPLHAVLSKMDRSDFVQLVALLLDHGADPNSKTKERVETGAFMRDCRTKGETPLHRAAAFAPDEVIQLLLDAGGDREIRDVNGDSPLSWASWYLRPRSILRKLCYGNYKVGPG